MSKDIATQFRSIVDRMEDKLRPRIDRSKIRIHVGSATCEHAAGSLHVMDEFQKHIRATGREDIVLHQTGCSGRCSCEPIVNIILPGQMPVKYQQMNREKVHSVFTSHVLEGNPLREFMLDAPSTELHQYELFFCQSNRCGKFIDQPISELFRERLISKGIKEERIAVVCTNCFGLCSEKQEGPIAYLLVRPSKVVYRIVSEEDIDEIIEQHIEHGQIVERLRFESRPISKGFFDLYGDIAFFNLQTRIALRNSGVIDPENIAEYVHHRGFLALSHVLERGEPEWVIEQISKSRLRGRGGGGYLTGLKWSSARKEQADEKYIICNADEGDPGAFMDRSMLEGDPFSIIEGMLIGGYAIGASRGFFYVRAEYPLAVKRVENALEQCREYGFLGSSILGSDFSFDIEIRLGAGAFVCGEETALIHSIEGERGQPRIRPPYPTERGLWGMPTVINNVETFANVPVVIDYGPSWFRQIGTEKSGGTKVFALAGKIKHTGLVEIPMGSTLRQIVYDIGGGIQGDRPLKAVQTGGPAGGCIPKEYLDTPVDFDSLSQLGSIMGSGGMIVMDDTDCMVDIAKYFLHFTENESCGKCTPCREGTKRMSEILERMTCGEAKPDDIDKLERLAYLVQRTSLCGLGRAAPNPVLSTLRYYRHEYEAHVHEKRCPSLRCVKLIHYLIDHDKCVGCTVCMRKCPVLCISGERKKAHIIDQSRCIRCGQCFEVCRFDAVTRS
jgi:NADH:ubiquinone oxidoreductase subunit F (NADH-binding)/(2Fe-2S) ferredoxin/ferredoxin